MSPSTFRRSGPLYLELFNHATVIDYVAAGGKGNQADTLELVPTYLLQKSPSRGLKGLETRKVGRNESLKVEVDFTFGRLQEGFKGT